jgi:hypothetical protein
MLGRIVSGALGGMSPEIARLLVRVQNGEFQDWLAKIAKHADGWEMSIPAVCETVILVMLGVLGGLVAYAIEETNVRKAFVVGIAKHLPSFCRPMRRQPKAKAAS